MPFRPGDAVTDSNPLPVDPIGGLGSLPVGGGTFRPGDPVTSSNPLPVKLIGASGGSSIAIAASQVASGFTGAVTNLTSTLSGTLTFSKVSGSAKISIAAGGVVSTTSNLNSGEGASFVARVQNTSGDAVEKSFTVTGQVSLFTLTLSVAQPTVATAVNLVGRADGSTLALKNAVTNVSINSGNGTVTFAQAGTYTFTVVETLAGAASSPKETAFTGVTVTSQLSEISFDNASLPAGVTSTAGTGRSSRDSSGSFVARSAANAARIDQVAGRRGVRVSAAATNLCGTPFNPFGAGWGNNGGNAAPTDGGAITLNGRPGRRLNFAANNGLQVKQYYVSSGLTVGQSYYISVYVQGVVGDESFFMRVYGGASTNPQYKALATIEGVAPIPGTTSPRALGFSFVAESTDAYFDFGTTFAAAPYSLDVTEFMVTSGTELVEFVEGTATADVVTIANAPAGLATLYSTLGGSRTVEIAEGAFQLPVLVGFGPIGRVAFNELNALTGAIITGVWVGAASALSLTQARKADSFGSAWHAGQGKHFLTADDTGQRNAELFSLAEPGGPAVLTSLNSMDRFGGEGATREGTAGTGLCYKAVGTGIVTIAGVETVLMGMSRHRYGRSNNGHGGRPYIQRATDGTMLRTASMTDFAITPQPQGGLPPDGAVYDMAAADIAFPGDRFPNPVSVQPWKDGTFGPGYEAGYHYIVSNNGAWSSGDHLIVARALIANAASNNIADWEFWNPTTKTWGTLAAAVGIIRAPMMVGWTSIYWNKPLGLWMAPTWGYAKLRDFANDPTYSTTARRQLYVSKHLLLGWAKAGAEITTNGSYYDPRFMAGSTSADGKTLRALVCGDFNNFNEPGTPNYRPNEEIWTLSTQALPATGNLITRWSASALPAQSDNTEIASWTDSVGGLVASGAAGSRPLYRTARQGGRPSVQFTGSQFLTAARGSSALRTAMDAKNYTLLIVAKAIGATSNGVLFDATNGASASSGLILLANGTRAGRFDGTAGNYAAPLAAAADFVTIGYSSATAHGYRGPSAGTTKPIQRVAINGGFVISGGSAPGVFPNDSGPGTAADFAIGANPAFVGATGVVAEIFDVIAWNRELTQPEMIQADNWARERYGVASPRAAGYFTIFDGDSLSAGYSLGDAGFSPPMIAATAAGLAYGQWGTVAISGQNIEGMSVNAPADIDGLAAVTGRPTRLVAFEAINQIITEGGPATAGTGAAAAAKMQTYVQARRAALGAGARIVLGTATAYADSTAAGDTQRQAYCTSLVNNGVAWGASVVVPIHTNANVGQAGAENSATYFQSDKVHTTGSAGASGNRVLAVDLLVPAL